MKVLVVGTACEQVEFKKKFGASLDCTFQENHDFSNLALQDYSVVFDYLIEENPEALQEYLPLKDVMVFVNIPKMSLAELVHVFGKGECMLAGFNGIKTFVDRPKLEISLLDKAHQKRLDEVMKLLQTEYLLVEDRVGMVIPRILVSIINEAYYTLQEGSADREDIDTAMKLSTRYPFGPFEWCEKVGIVQVYELLEAIYEDTKDERHKICPMLKREYLLNS